jgi:hypothetical protein
MTSQFAVLICCSIYLVALQHLKAFHQFRRLVQKKENTGREGKHPTIIPWLSS